MAAKPKDAGLKQIDAYERALIQCHLDRFAGHTADVIARERAVVEPLAIRIGAALRLDYLARSLQP